MSLQDPRRFILAPVAPAAVELWCLDCHGVGDAISLVRSWDNDAASLMEILMSAEEHERKVIHT